MAISSPNYTQFPNELLDTWLGQLTPVEFAVLAYIVRHTFGWQHGDRPEPITFNEFLKGRFRQGQRCDFGCGVRSSRTLEIALRVLEQKDLIQRVPSTTARGANGVMAYAVKVAAPLPAAAAASAGTLPSNVPASGGTLPSNVPALYLVTCPGALPSNVPSLSKEREKEPIEKEPGEGATAPAAPAMSQEQSAKETEPVEAAYDRDLWGNSLTLVPPAQEKPPRKPRPPTPYQRLMEVVRGGLGWDRIPEPLWAKWQPSARKFLQSYGVDDALGCAAWYFSDGYWYKTEKEWHISKLHEQMEKWLARGRPARKDEMVSKNGHKGQRLQPMTYEETQAAPPVVQCRCCGNQPGQDHESYCVSGLRGLVLVGQECVQ